MGSQNFMPENKNEVARQINQMIQQNHYRRTTVIGHQTNSGIEKLMIRAIPTLCGVAIEHLTGKDHVGPTDKQFILKGDRLEIRKNSIAIYKNNKALNLEDVTIVYRPVSN